MSHTTNTSTSSYGTVGYSSLTHGSVNNDNNNDNNDSNNQNYRVHENHHSNSSGDHSSFPIVGDESSLITVTNPASSQPASHTRSCNSRATSTFISSHVEPSHSVSTPGKDVGVNRTMKLKKKKNNSSNIEEESLYDEDNDEDMLKCVLSTGNNENSTYANDVFDFDNDEHKYSLWSSFRGMFELLLPLKIWLLLLCVAFVTVFVLLHSDRVMYSKVNKTAQVRMRLYLQWALCVISLLMLAPVQVWASEMFEDYGLTTFNEHVAAGDEEQSSFTLLSFGNIICAHSPLLILIAMLLFLPQNVMVWEVKLLVTGTLFLHLLCILGSGLAKLRLPLLSAFACFRSHYNEEEEEFEEEEQELEEECKKEEEEQLQQYAIKNTLNEKAYLLRGRNTSQSSQSENMSESHSQHHSHHHVNSEHQSPHRSSSNSHHHHHHHNHHNNQNEHHHSPENQCYQRYREGSGISSPLSPQNMYYKITHYLSSSPFLFYEYYSPHRFNKGHGVLLLSATIVFLIPSAYKFIYLSDRIPETSFISPNISLSSSLSSSSSSSSILTSATITTSSPSFSDFTVASKNANSSINYYNHQSSYARDNNNYYYNNTYTNMPMTYPSVPYKYAPTQLQTRLLNLSRALSICLLLVYGLYVAERCNVFKRASTLYNVITIVEEDINSPTHIAHNKNGRSVRDSNEEEGDDEDKEGSSESSLIVADESVNVEASPTKRRYRRLNIPPFCGPFLLSMSVVARVCRQCDKFRSRGCDEIAQPPHHCRPSHRDAISHTYYSKQFMLFWLVLLLLVQVGLCYVVFTSIRTPAQAELFASYSSLVYFVILPVLLESGHWLAVFMTTSITRTENINAAVQINNMTSNLVDVTTRSKGAIADKEGNNNNSNVNVANSIPVVPRNANYEAMLLRNSIDNTLDVMLLIFPLCVILSWILGANMNLTIHQFVALITVFVALIICELNWLVQNKYRGPNIPIYSNTNNYNYNYNRPGLKSGGTIWNRGERKNAQLIAVSPRGSKHSNKANSSSNNINAYAGKGMRRSCSHTCLDETNNTTTISRSSSHNSTNTVFRFHGFVLLIMYVVIIMISYTHDRSYYHNY